uniref:Uncharacterized protein n=1 Tax=Anguilla anguilla TaxID=7936 RepID=A0A0E9V2X1_ANGAN
MYCVELSSTSTVNGSTNKSRMNYKEG